MREHHALGLAGGPGREDHRHQLVGVDPVRPSRRSRIATGTSPRLQRGDQLVGQRDLVPQVLEVDQFGIDVQVPEPLHHLAAGEHVADAGPRDADVHHVGGDGVVQVDRDPPVEQQGGVGQHAGHRRGQQQPDVLLVGREHVPGQEPAHDERSSEEAAAR